MRFIDNNVQITYFGLELKQRISTFQHSMRMLFVLFSLTLERSLAESERQLQWNDPLYNQLAPYYNHEFISGRPESRHRHSRLSFVHK